MVDLLPPPRPRLYRLAVFLTEDQFVKLKALSRERREKPGRVASLIVEAVLKERDVGGGTEGGAAAGGA